MKVRQARGANRVEQSEDWGLHPLLLPLTARGDCPIQQGKHVGQARSKGSFWNTHCGNSCRVPFCVSWQMCQQTGPGPPGQEMSTPVHWDLGTDVFLVPPTPTSLCVDASVPARAQRK